uniref:NADH-ubiquinone oxidoreductase chain 6 n=1 Tax=Diartiger fossulatus TaxID=1535458 RepID=A0A0S2M765_9COLE|nr:NADH deshydrogenase subunit 6 [Diartiger fossulatus]
MNFLLWMNMIMSILFLLLNHPMSMGLILLIQTLLISMIMSSINNPWYSYIMFLIMVGGMLILFIYMTSIASNEPFKMSPILFMLMLMSLFSMSLFYMNMEKSTNMMNNTLSLNKYFNFPNMLLMSMLMMYLMITMIASVKIINLKYGPIRQK